MKLYCLTEVLLVKRILLSSYCLGLVGRRIYLHPILPSHVLRSGKLVSNEVLLANLKVAAQYT